MEKQRVHRPWLYGLLKTLDETFNQDFYADKVLEHHFKDHRNMGGRDRRFFAETFYEMVRWWRRLRYAAELPDAFEMGKISEADFRQVVTTWLLLRDFDLADFRDEGFAGSSARVKNRWANAPAGPIAESFPDWLWDKANQELGSDWPQLAHVSNTLAPIFLRVNRLKVPAAEVIKSLRESQIEVEEVPEHPEALRLVKRANVFQTSAFKQGWFEVQDLGSQSVAPLLQVEPGLRVADACAGAGGKTLHLAAMMGNKGKILALDVHDWKLKELRTRSTRAGADCIEVRLLDSAKVVKRLHGQMDRVLLDVPCSGSGVFRRNPDSKWKLSAAECDRLLATQAEILGAYAPMTKPGGKLVYATCSIFPSENRQQINKFLAAHSGSWELETEEILWPRQGGNDGFYAARLVRRG